MVANRLQVQVPINYAILMNLLDSLYNFRKQLQSPGQLKYHMGLTKLLLQ